MLRSLVPAGLLMTLAAVGAAASPSDVRLLTSGPSSVHFVVEVPEPALRAVVMPEVPEAVWLEIAGYETAAERGEPALPSRILLVAVPPRGEVRVVGTAGGARSFEGVMLAPQPRVERGAAPSFVRAPAAYAAPGARGGPRVRLLDVSWMRNQRVARIAVAPADYEPASRRLTVWTRVDVEVAIEPAAPTRAPAEPEDRFEPVYRDLLINYEQGREWRREAAAARPFPSLGPEPVRAPLEAVQGVGTASVFVGRSWIKIAVAQTGFYKVDFGQLRNLAPFSGRTDVSLDSLRLFTWPGVPVLDEANYCDGCDYREVAIGVTDNGDGVMNRNADAIYFYALGPSDWIDLYDPARPDTVFINNPYETRSIYYLTVSDPGDPVPGPFQRIAAVPSPPGTGAVTPDTFTARVHVEQDLPSEYRGDLSPRGVTTYWEKENWFWKSLETSESFDLTVAAPGRDVSLPGRLRARFWGLNAGALCDTTPFEEHLVDVAVNGIDVGRFRWQDEARYTIDTPVPGLQPASNTIRFTVPTLPTCPVRDDRVVLGWVDLFYPRHFEPVNDELVFDTPRGPGDYRFDLQPFTRTVPPRVFDVTDPYAPREIVSFLYDPVTGGQRLAFQIHQEDRRRFRVVRDSSIAAVPAGGVFAARPTSLLDLRNQPGADYLVIFYDDFSMAADSLAAWRRDFNGFTTTTVPVSALYDQFSGGRTDPAAIRNFLRATLQWGTPPGSGTPSYVTLLGSASYDYKNYQGYAAPGQPGALLPSYENNYDVAVRQQYATDDWMLNVDNPRVIIPDFFGGRIPVKDAATALDVVRNKVLFYERSAPFDESRNRVMLIADDNEQATDDDPLRWAHLGQTAKVDSGATPQHMDREYVYLHTYPDPDELGSTKPQAKQAILDGFNQTGIAVVNYIGHGSPFQVSDERVLIDSDVGVLSNAERLPIFIAASCDIGRYDDPRLPSLGEKLLLKHGGGVIGVISATGDVFSLQNAALNESLYTHVFRRDTDGLYHTPFSVALMTAKSGSQNSQKYQLLADAATRLNLPRYWVEVALTDTAGQPMGPLEQGQTVVVHGAVLNRPGGTPLDFDGVVALRVEDAAPLEKAPDCRLRRGCGAPCINNPYLPLDCRPQYYFRAGPIYRGDLGVVNGSFEGRFVVPMEARLGPRGRVRAYASGRVGGSGATDAVGSLRAGVDPGIAPTNDREGPRINLAFAGGATSVRPDAELRVLLFDPSGILITGHTLQNGIVVTIDENTTDRRDITASFRYAADSYQSGTAAYRLENLAPGPHRIRVSAADNLAAGLNAGIHRSSAVIDFEVSAAPPLRITGAYLFPNPTRSGGAGSGGHFVVDAPGDSVNALLRIYTVSGRVIRELKVLGGIGQVQIPWDGRDSEGDRLANGTYIFRVHVNVREPDGSSSPTQKAVAEGRIVIFDH